MLNRFASIAIVAGLIAAGAAHAQTVAPDYARAVTNAQKRLDAAKACQADPKACAQAAYDKALKAQARAQARVAKTKMAVEAQR